MLNLKQTLVLGALLLTAAGCSKSTVGVTDNPQPAKDAWVNDLTLPVPIEFSSSSVKTKATPSGSIEGTVMDNLDIGIFALAVEDGSPGTTGYYSGPNKEIWNTGTSGTVLLNNEHATTNTAGSIIMDEVKYYPVDSDRSYSFFSYYPYSETVDMHSDYARVLFDIGYTDIIYGYSHAKRFSGQENNIGFNAKYIRYLKSTSNYYELHKPNLSFNHMLTRLKINARIKDLTEGTSNVRVQFVRIKNTHNDAYLYIADSRAEGNLSGQLVGNRIGVINLKKDIGTDGTENMTTDFSDVALNGDETYLSEFLVLEAAEYTLEITFGIWNGEDFSNQTTKEYTIKKSDLFKAGTRYDVVFELDEALGIEVTYTLKDWVDGGTVYPSLTE